MKKCVKAILFLVLFFSLSFNVMAGADEEAPEPGAEEQALIDAGFPIVEGVYDAAAEGFVNPAMATDQMGDYISIYIRGKNINKETIKPVFYDEEGNVISGDVAAVEVSNNKWYGGAFFRIEKEDSPAWDIENTAAKDEKTYAVKLESLCGKSVLDGNKDFAVYGDTAAKVDIYRRDVFYTSFNEYEETLTLYFSSDIDLKSIEKLELGWFDYNSDTREYVMNIVKTVEACEITKAVNKFTGHMEQKAIFSLEGFDYENAFENWSPDFRVTFTNGKTGQSEVYDTSYPSDNISQILGRVSFFQSAYQEGKVSGGYDVILYYPYWIGGVYQFADTGNEYDYFLTKAEAEYLKGERFSYAEYKKGTGRLDSGNFNQDRQYSFAYYVELEKPAKPAAPVVTIDSVVDQEVTLKWNAVSGATGYRIYIVTEDGYKYEWADITETAYTYNELIKEEFSAMGYDAVEVKVCAYAEKNGIVAESELVLPISAPNKIVLSKATYTYNGKAKTPTVTVKDKNGDKISKDYYSVQYTNNKNAGTGKVTVTFKGKYAGFGKMTKTFKINPAKIDKVTLSSAVFTYNGTVRKPLVTVKAGTLTAATKIQKDNSNIDVTYPTGRKNAGTYTITVKGIGNYTGTLKKTFTIKPAKIDKVTLSSAVFTYNGTVRKPLVTVKAGTLTAATKIQKDNSNIDITYAAGRKNVGKYTITVKGVGNYTGTLTKSFTINPKKTSINSLTAVSKGFTVKWASQKVQITGYEIQYAANKNFDNADTVTATSGSTSKKVTKLKSGKTYYVRVRTYKVVKGVTYYSAWSNVKNIKTK